MIFLKHLTKQLSTLVALTLILAVFQPVQALSVHEQEAVIWPIYHEIVLDEARGWIYGSDNAGNKIDVISMSTLQLVKSYTLANDASPRGIALSPDGKELAVAQNGLGTILFINPDKNQGQGEVIATLPSTAAYQQPWKVIYGRPGRLYTSDNVMNSAIRVVDTTTHTVVASSLASFYGCLDLALSADKNTMYANGAFVSNPTLYKLDVSTDVPTVLTNTRYTAGYDGGNFILDSTEEYLFTSTGQVWLPDLSLQVGSTGLAGSMAVIPGRNAIAVTSPVGFVSFVETSNFYVVSQYALTGSVYGPLVSNAGGTKLFVSTSNGIQVIDLASFPPGTPTPLPSGTLPYEDLILDEARGVLYGLNKTGHTIGIISASTLQVVDEIRFKNGASPRGIDLRADGGELAVALWGTSQIAFIDPDSLQVNEYVIPTSLYGVPAALEPRRPVDVEYGRPGRLYVSTLDGIHVIDTDNYINIGMLNMVIQAPHLATSVDGNQLFANNYYGSPNTLYKYNIQTDAHPEPTKTPFNNGFSANTYILMHDQNRIMTDYGQVWSNPTDLNNIQKLGQFSLYNVDLVEIPSLDLVAAMGTPGAVSFVNTDLDSNYNIISTIPIPEVSLMGPGVVDSTDTNLYLNTEDGIISMKLDPALPVKVELEGTATYQSAFVNSLFNQPVTVRVLNYLGQPLQGITVKFQVLPGGASATFTTTSSEDASVVTDVNGVAVGPRLIANGINGSYNLKIYADGTLAYATYVLNNLETVPVDSSFEVPNGILKWSMNSTNFSMPLCTFAGCGNGGGTVGPHSGTHWVWFGGTTASEIASASQYIGLPDGMPNLKLRFYFWIGAAGEWSGHDDVFNVKIGDTTIFTADATQINAYPTYKPVVIDISGFSGYNQLTFSSTTNGQVVNFNLDDVLISSATFDDAMSDNWAQSYIERLYDASITGGCSTSPLLYCPDTYVSRAQMAVFLLRGEHGATYNPDVASGLVFGDVSSAYWASAWIEQLGAEGITGGCGGGNYCPELTVTRDQMAIFLLRAKHGSDYTPPAATGVFSDVPVDYWAAAWIEQLAAEGITGGCGNGNYCPSQPVTRAQMAVFLVKTFNLP